MSLLIKTCQYSIIYDQFMTDILITFLIALADSQVRAFRHTATLAVLKIMTSLVDVLLALSVTKDATQRQYENERQKSQLKRAQDRIDMLASKRKEIEENEYEVQNFINFIFKAVTIHRYRDVCPEIRCVCIVEIGEWMKRCPVKFLDDTFLKYIGWTLHDKVNTVACLNLISYEINLIFCRLRNAGLNVFKLCNRFMKTKSFCPSWNCSRHDLRPELLKCHSIKIMRYQCPLSSFLPL